MCNYRTKLLFILSFFHLSVCFFVAHASVRAYRVRVLRNAGPVEECAGARQKNHTFFLYSKDSVQTVRMHIWNFVGRKFS